MSHGLFVIELPPQFIHHMTPQPVENWIRISISFFLHISLPWITNRSRTSRNMWPSVRCRCGFVQKGLTTNETERRRRRRRWVLWWLLDDCTVNKLQERKNGHVNSGLQRETCLWSLLRSWKSVCVCVCVCVCVWGGGVTSEGWHELPLTQLHAPPGLEFWPHTSLETETQLPSCLM